MTALAERPVFDTLPCRQPGNDPDWWFAYAARDNARHHVSRNRALKAKSLCLDCPLYWQCQEYALNEGVPEGIWGGLDGRDRDRIWAGRSGGRPTAFHDAIDAAVRPLLQARRDEESYA